MYPTLDVCLEFQVLALHLRIHRVHAMPYKPSNALAPAIALHSTKLCLSEGLTLALIISGAAVENQALSPHQVIDAIVQDSASFSGILVLHKILVALVAAPEHDDMSSFHERSERLHLP